MKPMMLSVADGRSESAPTLTPIVMTDAQTDLPLRQEDGGRYRAEGVQVELAVSVQDGFQAVSLRLKLDEPRRVHFFGVRLGPLDVESSDRFFGDIPGFLEHIGVMSARAARDEQRAASFFAMVGQPGVGMLLAGIGGRCDDASAFFLRADGLCAGWRPDRVCAGEAACTLLIGTHRDPLVLLQDYGRALAPQGRTGPPPAGWNSWDYYGGAVAMRDIRREMTALRRLRCGDSLRYVCLDGGWEEAWGNWVPNRKFPARIARVADQIRAAGRAPGIWLAPFQVSLFTSLARYRQDLFLRDAEGSPVIVESEMPCGPALLLDFSLPEARELVGEWFAGLRRAGFELFKIDYLYMRFLAHARHSAGGLGLAAFVRALFETIRTAVGEEAHILNCGGLKEAALGLVDSVRVSVDIHTFWGHIRNNAGQLANSFWMNGALWTNDPDFALARGPHNCGTPWLNMPHAAGPLVDGESFWMRGPPATRDELRLWLSAVRLNGGSLFLSDSIRALDVSGRRDLDRLFPPLTGGFVPLDLFERPHPGIWLSRDRARPCAGLFNWQDTVQTLPLPPPLTGGVTGKDFWTGRRVRLRDSIVLPGRSGLLLDV